MKICQIVASSGLGGLEKHVCDLSGELARSEHVTLIAPAALKPYVPSNVRFISMDFERSRYNPFLIKELVEYVRKGQFDIVHAQANKAVCLLAKMSAFINNKTIGTIHNSHKKKGKAFKKIDHVIAVSQEAGSRIDPSLPVTVIYNGIDVSLQRSVLTRDQVLIEFGLSAKRPLLCSVGRLVQAKGFDLLLEAVKELDVNLIILGDGELKKQLQATIDQFNLSDKVVLAGHRKDVMSILNGVDGMVIASRNEGFSYVFVEAILSGVPVISTDVSTKEFLPDELIMSKTVDSIRAKINCFAFAKEEWLEHMQPVFLRAQHELTLAAMGQKTLSVYQSVLRQC